MKLFEYEAKNILSKYGVPVPRGELATSPEQASEIASKLNIPCVIKAQVLVAGRGKAGGILFAENPQEAKEKAEKLLNSEIKGIKVRSVWIEEKLSIKKELYFGVTVDRFQRTYVAIASSAGGMDIEEIAAKAPEKLIKFPINPLEGFRTYHATYMAKKLGYKGKQMLQLASTFSKLYRAAMDYDAELMEMNPLVETVDGRFVAADARLIIDDNALFRHPDYKARLAEEGEFAPEEIEAREKGLAYVKLDGDIGIIGNGAGLVMATLDAINSYGGKPANFLDVGGGASADRIAAALDIVLSNPNVKVVFMNILGGITRCDEVARGILEAKNRIGFTKPMIIRLVGTNEEEGKKILTEAGIYVMNSMEEAAKKAVEVLHQT